MENESNVNSLQTDQEKVSWQENIFNAMEVFENVCKETSNHAIKDNLKMMIDDLSALFDYYSKQAAVSKESFTTISNYISAVLDLLNLEKKYHAEENHNIPIHIETPIRELSLSIDIEVRKLYIKHIISDFHKVIETKDNSPFQQEKDLKQIKQTLALLKQAKTITQQSDSGPAKPIKKKPPIFKFSFEAVVGTVICWLAFIVFWPSKYTDNLFLDIVVGLIIYVIFYFYTKRIADIEKTEDTPKDIQPLIEQELKEDQKAMDNKAKKQIVLLKDYNEKIPDEKVSRDIEAIIHLVEAIMKYLEKYPSQANSMNKFLDYYLPTVMKLLEVYQLYDEIPNLSEDMKVTLTKIEASLESMKQALNKKIDQFYQEESMVTGANIAMLNTLLHQEGLLEDSLDKLKGGITDE